MLVQFTVENYLSFDEAQTFSMAATRDQDHPLHIIVGQPPLVRGAAIYGANAAGKSNLVAAMHFARELIVAGRALDEPIGAQPFGLGKGAARPSQFHWQFVCDGQKWSYGFDLSARAVSEEYLFSRPAAGGREKKWFERTTGEDGTSRVSFGPGLVGRNTGRLGARLQLIAENLRPQQPFLRHALHNNVEELRPPWGWFRDALHILRADESIEALNLTAAEAAHFVEFAGELLRFADTGIVGLELKKTPFEGSALFDDLDAAGQIWVEGVAAREEPRTLFIFGKDAAPIGIECDENGDFWSVRFAARHRSSDGEGATQSFPLEWESDGTKRLLQLAATLFLLRQDSFVMVVDELDRRLHTLLLREFVGLAWDESARGQFIFTLHDTRLLDAWLLRRDEVWFVDKNAGGASSLARLSDWKVRSDLDYEKAYLQGAFAARPYFQWSALLRGLPPDGNGEPPNQDELRALK